MSKLSVVTIAKNEELNLKIYFKNVKWADEIIFVDNKSIDNTLEIAKKYTNKVFTSGEKNLGLIKQFALNKATKDWILLLDVDERISGTLLNEIKRILVKKSKYEAYSITYQNHFLGHKLSCRAQQYSKVRLFKKNIGFVTLDRVHEEVIIKGPVGKLNGYIEHYSFRSIPQVFKKFIYYAHVEAEELFLKGESLTIKKLTLYPIHMFWSIFIEDQGYKDSIWGLILALCFAYYEFMRYFLLLIIKIKSRIKP